MQWVPQKPPSHGVKLLAFAIAAIPIALVIVAVILVVWQLLGGASLDTLI
jgi:hypothetical protein